MLERENFGRSFMCVREGRERERGGISETLRSSCLSFLSFFFSLADIS